MQYLEPVYSKEYLKLLDTVEEQIKNATSAIIINCNRFRIDPAEQWRIVMEDEVIRSLNKMLIDRAMLENPKWIIKTPGKTNR